MRAAALAEAQAGRAAADPGRRHRALFQGADPGAFGGAADPGRRFAPRCAARLDAEGTAALHAELARRDPAWRARLMPGDRMRITRALEVLEATGRSLADWHRDGMPAILDPDEALKVFLAVDRAELYRRIDARFDAMLAAGALDEVRALAGARARSDAAGDEGARRALAAAASGGEIRLEEAAEGGKRDTRRYTKRQVTWFRHQMPDFVWTNADEALGFVAGAVGR